MDLHRKTLHSKRSFANARNSESAVYDASEEDAGNDASEDDASIRSVHLPPAIHARQTIPTSPLATGKTMSTATLQKVAHAQHRPGVVAGGKMLLAPGSDDSGMESGTYDGDIESSTTAAAIAPSKLFGQGRSPSLTPSPIASPSSPAFPPAILSAHSPSTSPKDSDAHSAYMIAAAKTPLVSARGILTPVEPPPPDVPQPPEAASPSSLTPEQIQAHVRNVIEGKEARPYKVNPPPTDRPVRIYADGVYDMFHFGHALQLRQAKLSFPSVHLLVGVCSDELVDLHKARTVMTHTERCESVRHCRWADEVIPEAPWIIDDEFLKKWEIDYVAHDDEPYAGINGVDDVYGFVKEQGKFIPTHRTPGVSTSELLGRMVVDYRKGEFDRKLEKMGHAELMSRPPSRGASSRGPGSPVKGTTFLELPTQNITPPPA
ncbi:hypothetical protein BOTBODRAFT_30338 [Botryobasidium botryosum FD-172 SS1]|uniref:choline-phosphate cytidylyltransferase n=1 Tax=Botryobasidium botryosum (strain FD-172 SS1) TaxID=930990 RepID=A0A067MQG9_BOTB1|nr:hypothetical protein BOTBODRAFT_30338 [Botryobasidium botryosum FD-172 SS1]